ncbi:MAG: ATP-binding cassette domain-containing protein, partial [Bradyrhizobium sp.]|uniref:ATP-binding cassette domain-containing protein n=1 Tax=Bradyrhizobium sp. TaxID=376 RepID=UPI0027318B42
MSSVQIRDVRKSLGGFEVLHGVSIPIEDGAFVVLAGPSGCGKSTLLRMLAGLENITSGTISIGDKVVNNVQPKERDIAMVFQNYALYPHMKVKSNGSASFEGPNGVKLPLASAPANSEGRPAVYGVRPEHFTIADDGVEAEIVVVEPTGSETQVFAKLGGQQVVAV